MSEVKKYDRCPKCFGTKIFRQLDPHTGEETIEDPCANCRGEGFFEEGKIDTTDIMEQLDYIHGKVTAIWNKIKND